MSRYARQMMLPQLGAEGQARLAAARVLVVGAGGLAASALPLLAGAGVGQIDIFDGDLIELSNLHRQTLFTEDDVGRAKAEVAAERCRALNSGIVLTGTKRSITPENVIGACRDVDLVLDCADSYAASYLLSDTCLALGKPLISASVLGLSGYAGGFCGGSPSLRAVFPEAPDSAASCATAGVLGPAVSLLGSIQAQMTLSMLLGLEPSPLGQMVQIDAQTWRNNAFRFDHAPEPETAFRFVALSELTADDLVFELRSEDEAPHPAHPSARRMTTSEIEITDTNQGKRLVLCCATGLRAWRAAEQLQPDWPGEIVLVAAATS
ncbi:thiazole biosynthesis adenylyltransferase ThiF [Ruegeria pomeroyi]|uniref:Thiazole biosynthesis adenylyltransferase ThiF n=1 Tax=Ruegeria pomeroyi TaxID=89184 RepID=A0A9Q3WP16_9RHOB|nr:thiazole biosynthesis adenylyltransferase ThiF [Ruegeria pomeroyi]MCE8538957.1 thiazole biosynthesis adenylyltransferase ThiF [Ruegeria pomeroyi]